MITIIKKTLAKLLHWIDKLTATPINENDKLQAERCAPWFAAKGDETLRLDYELNQHSIVFDIGGYKGEFAREISCKYNATIYVFEPIKSFYEIARQRFINNPKVHVYNFGLGANDTKAYITLEDNGSSLYGKGTNKTEIAIRSFNNFIAEHNITTIDLAKLNIEGAEYELLESIVKAGNTYKLRNLQIQFHDFVIANAKPRMNALQHELSKTHTLTYQYEFVWENWKINN